MLRILGRIELYGTKEALARVASVAPIQNGAMIQIGLERKVPDVNHWTYKSPRYQFHLEEIDNEIRAFVIAHSQLGQALPDKHNEITHAFLTITPVEQTEGELFACDLSAETVLAISSLGIGIQIAPAEVMPEAPFWKQENPSQ